MDSLLVVGSAIFDMSIFLSLTASRRAIVLGMIEELMLCEFGYQKSTVQDIMRFIIASITFPECLLTSRDFVFALSCLTTTQLAHIQHAGAIPHNRV